MEKFHRITHNPAVMGGKPCIRGMRATVGMIVGMMGAGHSKEPLLERYPYLEPEDIDQALACAVLLRLPDVDPMLDQAPARSPFRHRRPPELSLAMPAVPPTLMP